MIRTFALAAAFAALAGSTLAAPVLKSEVTVAGALVTAGDMFDDAGDFAAQPMFRAPAPGTTGTVSLEAVKEAAGLIGLSDYQANGVVAVRVARAATVVDQSVLTRIITDDLTSRGIVGMGVTVETAFDTPNLTFNAESVANPVQLLTLRYTPGNGVFAARFLIAGTEQPIDVGGRIELMIEAPHLVATKPAGTVLTPADIEMRLVPLRNAETNGIATLDQLVGKQLMRQSRSGLMLRPADVTEPRVVERNANVTVILRNGPMTLTVKGQALNSAAAGQPVQVLNSASKKILTGMALPGGAVEITSNTTINVAGL
jgi:flagella basal body P-ring formation protein FlgA